MNAHHHIPLGLSRKFRRLAPGIGKKPQRPGSGNRRIQLPQTAGRRIARIGKGLVAVLTLFLIEFGEVLVGHVYFAAHFQHRRGLARQFFRHIANRLYIGRDVFPFRPVAARRRLHQLSIFVAQRYGKPVDLGFGRDFDFGGFRQVQKPPDPARETP